MGYMWKAILSVFLLALPAIVSAAGLIPCGGDGEDPCQTCHFYMLISNVSGWLAVVLGIVVTIMIMVAGLRLVMSAGDASAKAGAKKLIANGLIGYVIILSCWLSVDLGLKTLANESTYKSWTESIQCVTQPTAVQWSRTTASGDNSSVLPPADINNRVSAITSSGALQTNIANAAASAGITNPEHVDLFRALISQESKNCTQEVSSAKAYGCGQILVGTARTLDPTLSGKSDDEVAKILVEDDLYNLNLSAKYYKQLLTRYAGDTDLALAAYNGGPGANQPSTDCPGQKRWQCIWDSPGCHETGRTDCKPNQGINSYAQTRNYVKNINAIADRI